MFKLVLFVFVIALPNIILSFNADSINIFYSFISIVLSFLVLLLCKNTKNLMYFLPFIIFIPIAIYYAVFYQRGLDTFGISVAIDSNLYEIKSFFGDGLFYLVVIFLSWSLFSIYLYGVKRNSWNINLYSTKKETAYVYGIAVLVFGSAYLYFTQEQKYEFKSLMFKTYPYNLIESSFEVYSELNKMKDVEQKIRNYKFFATQPEGSKADVVVLVIGETGRHNNWGLNGYTRPTTPLLSRQKNLINFTDMLSLAPATIVSVPMMLTRKPENKIYEYVFTEPSIIRAFKEVGYKTYWISTQQKVSNFDSLTSAYAKEADVVRFFNYTQSSADRDKDDVLIPELNKILKENTPKKFIIIHTLGSHQQYNKRYPESFNIYRPSLDDMSKYNPQSPKYKTQSVNSYDNSILFTDYVLNSFIEQLKSLNNSSFLLYAADHGEDLFDGACDKSGHGNHTIYNFQVPAIVWVSDQYKNTNPEKYSLLRLNSSAKVNHTSIFPTLVDATGIVIPSYKPERSLAMRHKSYTRTVLHGIDYDKTLATGVCKELK